MAIDPGSIMGGAGNMFNTFFYLFGSIIIVLIIALAYYMNKKGAMSIPIVTKYNYSITMYEPASDGLAVRKAKGRKFTDKDGITYLEVSEGMLKKPYRCLMPAYEFMSSAGDIILWRPTADEFYPCKMDVQASGVAKTAILHPQIDKSMKIVLAHTQEKIAARNREKNWIETVLPLAGLLLFGILLVMLIYVTMSQTTAYQAEVAQAFIQAAGSFKCPAVTPPI